jgi:hypothetical protein
MQRRSVTAASPGVGCGAGAVSENAGGRWRLCDANTSSLRRLESNEHPVKGMRL